jgi:hypothetical protein
MTFGQQAYRPGSSMMECRYVDQLQEVDLIGIVNLKKEVRNSSYWYPASLVELLDEYLTATESLKKIKSPIQMLPAYSSLGRLLMPVKRLIEG